MRKKIDQRQNASLQSYLTMNSVIHQSIRARHAKDLKSPNQHYNCSECYFAPALL